ncbi:hypothetical protein DITRI_Ditri20bG0019400 [Diplodiscus trichospermus]
MDFHGDHHPLAKCGLGLISNETPARVNPNVIESSSVLLNIKLMTPTLPPPSRKKDPGGIGFIDEMGGGVDGLMSCTESLGFESCDERRVDDDEDNDDNEKNDHHHHYHHHHHQHMELRKRSEGKRSERKEKKFPPPISSLNQNGQPCFYLKPVRKNGRLELTEVRIQRPEILRAVRENGRLRLHLVGSDVFSKINEEDEDDEENEEIKQEEEEEEEELDFHLQGEEKKVEEIWKHGVNGEGRRCHELVMTHHHHNHQHHINDHHSLHVWRQPCATTS